MSGEITVTPGYNWPDGVVSKARLNQAAQPTAQLDAASVGSRELIASEVRQLVPNVNRNVLINGNFNVWQRGGYTNFIGLPATMGAGTGPAMGADRWVLNEPSGASKRAISRGDFTTGQSDVPNEPQYYLHWNETVAQTGVNRPQLSQWIEDVRTLAGKSVVVTWWMKGDYSGAVTCQLRQFLGGSPGQTVTIAADSGGTATLVNGAAWTQFTAKFTIPSLAGYSLSTNHYLGLDFLLPDNVTFQIDFAQVQMEEGTDATSFETLPYLEELRRCERYFEYHGGVAADDVTHIKPCYYFATRKYRAVTMTLIAGYSGTMTAANFATILDTGYYQNTANSAVSAFFMACEAEISMP